MGSVAIKLRIRISRRVDICAWTVAEDAEEGPSEHKEKEDLQRCERCSDENQNEENYKG